MNYSGLLVVISALLVSCTPSDSARADLGTKVRGYESFPIVWAGESFDSDGDGFAETALTLAQEYSTPPGRFSPATSGYQLYYGTCANPPCAIPVSMTFYARCATPPLADELKGKPIKVRGGNAYVTLTGMIWFETADFTLSLWYLLGPPEEALSFIERLEGANEKASHLSRDAEFRERSAGDCEGEEPSEEESLIPECCALFIDLDPAQEAIQSTLPVAVGTTATIDVVYQAGPAIDVGSFNFKLVYDDTLISPLAPASSGLDGNLDFNQAALGSAGWNCTLPAGSGTPDIDPLTGPGHGVSLLSCFITGTAPVIAGQLVIASFSFEVVGTDEVAIDIAEAQMAQFDGTEISSCAPVVTEEMACHGGTVTGYEP